VSNPVTRSWVLVPLLVTGSAVSAQQQHPACSPGTGVASSDSVICWNYTRARSVYISGIGVFPPGGRVTVPSTGGTRYTVIAEGVDRIWSDSVVVRTGNPRSGGVDPATLEIEFKSPLQERVSGVSYTVFLNTVRTVLQSQMRSSVDTEFERTGGTYVFVTTPRSLAPLPSRPSRARRVAYVVFVQRPSRPGAEIVFTVRTRIEFRRRAEPTWNTEDCCDTYFPLVNDLLARIKSASLAR
jgi:hypothetical protein